MAEQYTLPFAGFGVFGGVPRGIYSPCRNLPEPQQSAAPDRTAPNAGFRERRRFAARRRRFGMGYACPVCSDPQADAGHLANHLAFTAILGDDDHEAWLDEHAPEWNEMGEDKLAAAVSEHVEETDFPQLFDDTVGGLDSAPERQDSERSGVLFEEDGYGHDHGRQGPIDTSGPTDAETERVLEEAREMTQRMLEDEEDGSE